MIRVAISLPNVEESDDDQGIEDVPHDDELGIHAIDANRPWVGQRSSIKKSASWSLKVFDKEGEQEGDNEDDRRDWSVELEPRRQLLLERQLRRSA